LSLFWEVADRGRKTRKRGRNATTLDGFLKNAESQFPYETIDNIGLW
jgi:hypothetical protein